MKNNLKATLPNKGELKYAVWDQHGKGFIEIYNDTKILFKIPYGSSAAIQTLKEAKAIAIQITASPEMYKALRWLGNIMLEANDGGDAWCAIRKQKGADKFFDTMKFALEKVAGKHNSFGFKKTKTK